MVAARPACCRSALDTASFAKGENEREADDRHRIGGPAWNRTRLGRPCTAFRVATPPPGRMKLRGANGFEAMTAVYSMAIEYEVNGSRGGRGTSSAAGCARCW